MPLSLFQQFRFVFLIRPPEDTVPSYYRLTRSPQWIASAMHAFKPNDVSYKELRTLFDYFYGIDKEGIARKATGHSLLGSLKANICVIDSGDLVDQPAEIMQKFCEHMNVEYKPEMLSFGEMDRKGHAAKALRHRCNALQESAMTSKKLASREPKPEYEKHDPRQVCEKYCGRWKVEFKPEMWDHLSKGKEDVANWLRRCRNVMQDFAIESRRLGPQDEGNPQDADCFLSWEVEFGPEAALTIAETVKAIRPDYIYLKCFAMNVSTETPTQRVLRLLGPDT